MAAAGAHRRRTDLMPTAPLSAAYNSPSSRSSTPKRGSGRTASMSRLDQLARPRESLLTLHAASAKIAKQPPTTTIPSDNLVVQNRGMSASLSHLNKSETEAAASAPKQKPSKPVTRRATTVGASSGSRRSRAPPPAARSSGNNDDNDNFVVAEKHHVCEAKGVTKMSE